MRKTAGFAEATERKIVDWFERALTVEVELRAGIQHEASNAQRRECMSGHAAGSARSDDEYVVILVHGSVSRERTSMCRCRFRYAGRWMRPPTGAN